MRIRHLLFDLDGTLLPMKQDEFVAFYMPLLARIYLSHGVEMEGKQFLSAVWKGYERMVKNDGSCTNREAFWNYMKEQLPMSEEEAEALALEFYDGEFNKAAAATFPTPLSSRIVKRAREKGMDVYLATNPVFPRCATLNRIRWAGLQARDFKTITTYENCVYCKPNPAYYTAILKEFRLRPQECLMVGNSVEEDLAARKLGISTYLVTDTMENPGNLPIETDYQGTLVELLEFVEGLEEI